MPRADLPVAKKIKNDSQSHRFEKWIQEDLSFDMDSIP